MSKNSNIKIAWYCPYTLPPLLDNTGIELLKLEWENKENTYLGNMKLCRKMTSIFTALENRNFHGIVMADCCNVSVSISEYLKHECHNLFIHIVHVPRKKDAFFADGLLEQWKKLRHALQTLAESDLIKSSCISLTSQKDQNECKFSITHNKWCNAPESIRLMGHDFSENLQVLMNEVACPRVLSENNKLFPEYEYIKYSCNELPEGDECCIIQKFWECIFRNRSDLYAKEKK